MLVLVCVCVCVCVCGSHSVKGGAHCRHTIKGGTTM